MCLKVEGFFYIDEQVPPYSSEFYEVPKEHLHIEYGLSESVHDTLAESVAPRSQLACSRILKDLLEGDTNLKDDDLNNPNIAASCTPKGHSSTNKRTVDTQTSNEHVAGQSATRVPYCVYQHDKHQL